MRSWMVTEAPPVARTSAAMRPEGPAPMTETSGRITAERLAHAVDTAAGLHEHAYVGIVDGEAHGAHLGVEVRGAMGREHPVVAQRHHVAAERHRLLEARGDDFDLLRLEPSDDIVLGRLKANRRAMIVEHADHQVDVNIELVDG